jgi:hypothetical protein
MSELKSPLALQDMTVEHQRCLHIALHFQRSQGWGRTLKHSKQAQLLEMLINNGLQRKFNPINESFTRQFLMVVISNLPSKNLAKQLATHMRYPKQSKCTQ